MSSIAPMVLLKKKREANQGGKRMKKWVKAVLIGVTMIVIFLIVIAIVMVSF